MNGLKFEVGQKIDVKNIALRGEIISVRPGSQGIRLNDDGDNYYEIVLGGMKMMLAEKVICYLMNSVEKSVEKPVVVEEIKVEPIIEAEKPVELSAVDGSDKVKKKNRFWHRGK